MSGFDLSSLLTDSIQGSKTFTDLAAATTENTAAQNDITSVMVQQAKVAQQAAEAIATTQGQAKLATQKSVLQVANTMGTNAQDSGWLIGDMGKRVIESDKRAQELLGTIQAKQSASFIDNPIGYLVGLATVDGDINNYNAEVRKSDLAKDTASKLEQMSQASFLTQNAIEQTVTESSIAQTAILQGYKYSSEANQAALQGLRTNLEGLTRSAQATAQAIDFKFKGNEAIMREKQMQISYANLDLARKNFALNSEAKRAKIDEDSLIGKFISQGYFATSGNKLDPVRGKEMIALYKAGQPEIRKLFDSGMQSYMIAPDGSKPVINTSPYDASEMFATRMVQNLPKAQQDVGQWLIEKRRAFENPAIQNKLQLDPKDKGARERAFNEYIRGEATRAGATGAEIYAPASLVTVAKANPNMAALPVWNKVLAPMVAAGSTLDDPSLVMGAVQTAIRKGDISYNDALKITTLYKSGVDMNNMSRNWLSTGLPMGVAYVTPVKQSGEVSRTQLNLTDDTAVATFLNRTLTQQRLLEKSGFQFSMPTPGSGQVLSNLKPIPSPYKAGTYTSGQSMDSN